MLEDLAEVAVGELDQFGERAAELGPVLFGERAVGGFESNSGWMEISS